MNVTLDQYNRWKEHAETFPKNNASINVLLRIPGVHIIAYEKLIWDYQNNPLAHYKLNELKNRVRENLYCTSKTMTIMMLFALAIGIEIPLIVAIPTIGILGLSLAHCLGRVWLHRGWNHSTCRSQNRAQEIFINAEAYTRGSKNFIISSDIFEKKS